jgi:hypothetical protein
VATYQQLQDEVAAWLNRRDIGDKMPGWVAMVETEIAETCRTRCQVVSGLQLIDNAYITLPPDFATMESIRDARTGELLELKDEWSGSWVSAYQPNPWTASVYGQTAPGPCTAYRLVHDCIELLPHPVIPDPPDPMWKPQQVLMGWYAKPKPLVLPSDTNTILEAHYGIYLFGVCKYGAMFELDDDRTQQMDAAYQQMVTRANLWKQQSDYSGAPFRSELATVF